MLHFLAENFTPKPQKWPNFDPVPKILNALYKTYLYYYTNTQFNRLNVPLESDEIIASISAGYSHYAFTTSKGNLFTFGEGSQGQLCNGDCSRLDSPKLVSKFGRDLFFEKVVCGGSFTVTCVRKRNDGGQPFHSGVADSVANVVPGAVVSDSGVVPPVKKPGFFDKLFGSKRKADVAKPELGPDGQPISKKSKSCTILWLIFLSFIFENSIFVHNKFKKIEILRDKLHKFLFFLLFYTYLPTLNAC